MSVTEGVSEGQREQVETRTPHKGCGEQEPHTKDVGKNKAKLSPELLWRDLLLPKIFADDVNKMLVR